MGLEAILIAIAVALDALLALIRFGIQLHLEFLAQVKICLLPLVALGR